MRNYLLLNCSGKSHSCLSSFGDLLSLMSFRRPRPPGCVALFLGVANLVALSIFFLHTIPPLSGSSRRFEFVTYPKFVCRW